MTQKWCTHRLHIWSRFEFVALLIFHMSGGPALPWGAVPHDQRPRIEVDLPSRKGLYPGARIEVKWLIDDDEAQTREIRVSIHLHFFTSSSRPALSTISPSLPLPSLSQWWPATIIRKVDGRTDGQGRYFYLLRYDSDDATGFEEQEETESSFIDDHSLFDATNDMELSWRREGDRWDDAPVNILAPPPPHGAVLLPPRAVAPPPPPHPMAAAAPAIVANGTGGGDGAYGRVLQPQQQPAPPPGSRTAPLPSTAAAAAPPPPSQQQGHNHDDPTITISEMNASIDRMEQLRGRPYAHDMAQAMSHLPQDQQRSIAEGYQRFTELMSDGIKAVQAEKGDEYVLQEEDVRRITAEARQKMGWPAQPPAGDA